VPAQEGLLRFVDGDRSAQLIHGALLCCGTPIRARAGANGRALFQDDGAGSQNPSRNCRKMIVPNPPEFNYFQNF
jgi:hypothetical protein